MMQIIFLLLSIVANRFTHVDGCKELWFNECVDNSDCCSTYCDRPADFKYGVCKPESLKNDIGNKVGCHENDYNLCKVDENCCSGYCDRPESWEHGMNVDHCTTTNASETMIVVLSIATWGPQQNWKFGVCKNQTINFNSNTDENKSCYELWYNGCSKSEQCCSGFCYKGDEQNWQFGVCKWPEEEREKLKLLVKLFAKITNSTGGVMLTDMPTTTTTTDLPETRKPKRLWKNSRGMLQ
ncbi:hypothetical protein BLOT_016669 [Blomia tropicalis]|nr:hypothetical protein BLOT_016669 [Blomia tropicalis]